MRSECVPFLAMKSVSRLRPFLAGTLLFALTLSAQPSGPAPARTPDAEEVTRLEAFTVTGSNIRRVDAETALPVTVIDRNDLDARGAVKQHADVVLALYREEMYAPGTGVEGATELLVRKNRNGGTGYVDLYFYKQWLRFEDMLDPDR